MEDVSPGDAGSSHTLLPGEGKGKGNAEDDSSVPDSPRSAKPTMRVDDVMVAAARVKSMVRVRLPGQPILTASAEVYLGGLKGGGGGQVGSKARGGEAGAEAGGGGGGGDGAGVGYGGGGAGGGGAGAGGGGGTADDSPGKVARRLSFR